ncbi:MAG: hypothetical protein ACUVX1_17545 [Chloroflexota bacterium]
MRQMLQRAAVAVDDPIQELTRRKWYDTSVTLIPSVLLPTLSRRR